MIRAPDEAAVDRVRSYAHHTLACGCSRCRLLDTLRALDADTLRACYGIDVECPADAPLDRAMAAWWQEGRP